MLFVSGRKSPRDERDENVLSHDLWPHMPMSSDYRLHGLCLRATSDDATIRKLLRRTLRYKGAEAVASGCSPDVTLAFRVGRSLLPPPEAAQHVGTSARCEIDVWDAPEGMLLRHNDATVAVHPDAGRAEGQVHPALFEDRDRGERDPLFHLVVLSLVVLLRHRGWFPLHAAALTRDGHGVLCPAQSGQGKTTITLSLLRYGWAALSDDTVLLRAEDDRVNAHSFRRSLCVDPGAAEPFPELHGPDWPRSLSDASKWRVEIDQLYPGQSASVCTPRLLVLPTIADAPMSRIEPIGIKPALEQLLRQTAFFLTPAPRVADRHLAVLRRLVNQSWTYRLHAGRDILNDPRTVHTLLAPLLDDGSGSGVMSE